MANLAKHTQLSITSVVITGITDLQWSGLTADQQETTSNDSASRVKTFQPTLYSNGDFTATILWDGTNTQHAALRTLSTSGAAGAFEIEYTGTSAEHNTFSGYVTSFAFVTPTNGLQTAKIKIMVNGDFTAV